MNKKKILSLIMALVMLVGVFSPLSALAAEVTTTEKVTLHKLIMTKDELSKWDSDALEKAGYNGTQDTEQLKTLLNNANHSAHEVAGVYFALRFGGGHTGYTNTENKKYENNASISDVEATKIEEGKFVKADPADKLKPLVLTKKIEGKDVKYLVATDKLDEAVGGLTEANGVIFKTSGLKGVFKIDEFHEKSTYYNEGKGKEVEKGKIITDSRAVPVEITLPLVNNDGVVENAHVYPKNTEDKPKIDKNFKKADTAKNEKELKVADGFDAADTGAGIGVGADVKNYQAKKATAKAEIGKKIPYEVKTVIPAKSNLAEAKWDDKMTEGLTYNKDLKVTIGGTDITPSTEELVQTDNGFTLRLKGNNLALLNGKDAEVTVVLTYTATVNSKAIVDIPEANDITFHYGNTPSKGNAPKPTKPNKNGEIKVEKTWDNGSKWVESEYAKFKLVDAYTGEDVKAKDLVNAPEDYEFEGTVKLEKDGNHTYTWKYLNKDKQYKVVEVESKTLSDAEYTEAKDGTIKVTNHKSNNPKPLNPTEPKVVNGGKKFVKTDQEGNRLPGAEFYVKNAEGKYLVADQKDASKVTDAKSLYIGLIAAYNDAIEKATGNTAEEKENSVTVKNPLYKDATTTPNEKENLSGKTEINKKIEDLRLAYEKAFKENATAYKWETDKTNAVVLVSDGQGRFEITGLEYGDYKLEEKEAPKGFAKLNGTVDFKVEKGSYTTIGDIDYSAILKEGEKQTKAQKIENKKVSIPQTGGMGTVLFTVVGITLMAGAVLAMKRNREEA